MASRMADMDRMKDTVSELARQIRARSELANRNWRLPAPLTRRPFEDPYLQMSDAKTEAVGFKPLPKPRQNIYPTCPDPEADRLIAESESVANFSLKALSEDNEYVTQPQSKP